CRILRRSRGSTLFPYTTLFRSRMITAHSRSALTMNFVRALIDGGFADLHHPEYWNLAWMRCSPLAEEYQKMVASIGDSVHFMETDRKSTRLNSSHVKISYAVFC